jgi:hypothetical protein
MYCVDCERESKLNTYPESVRLGQGTLVIGFTAGSTPDGLTETLRYSRRILHAHGTFPRVRQILISTLSCCT